MALALFSDAGLARIKQIERFVERHFELARDAFRVDLGALLEGGFDKGAEGGVFGAHGDVRRVEGKVDRVENWVAWI